MGDEYTTAWLDIISIISTGRNDLENFILKYVFQASIHGLWMERNSRRHGEVSLPSVKLIRMIDRGVINSVDPKSWRK